MVKKILIFIGIMALGSLITLCILCGFDVLPREGYRFSFDTLISALGVVASVAAIIFIVRNTNKQIRNQNKESHRPYIILYRGNDAGHTSWTSNIRTFNCENVGCGICVDVMTWCSNKARVYDDVKEKSKLTLKFNASIEDSVSAIILYRDMFGNLYSSIIVYESKNTKMYRENSSEFQKHAKSIGYAGVLKKDEENYGYRIMDE